MTAIINILHRAFDLFFVPFARLDPFWGMLAVSAVTGVLMLIVYKYTSNQAAIARVKDIIKAHLLEAWIYREDVGLMLRAQVAVLRANMKYIALNLQPLLVMIVPVLFILVSLNFRYGTRPLEVGEEIVVKTFRKTAVTADKMDERLETPDGVEVLTPGVRIEERGEVGWRVRILKKGAYTVTVLAGGREYTIRLVAGSFGTRVASRRYASIGGAFFYPGEPALPSDGVLSRIEINYPTLSPAIPGTKWRPHWLIQYFVLSLIFGLALRGPFKVEI